MASLDKRLSALEEKVSPADEISPEERDREAWFTKLRLSRLNLRNTDAAHARSLIALFRIQNLLGEMDFGELLERILSWRPTPEEGRDRNTVEREVSIAIYRGVAGTEHLECPQQWRDALEATDELLSNYEAVPDEVLARAYMRLMDAEEAEDADRIREAHHELWSTVGSVELLLKREGPGSQDVPMEERSRRLEEILAKESIDEKHFRMWKYIRERRAA